MRNSTPAIVIHPEFNLYQKNNRIFCSSLQVAQEFGKKHQHVLRDIEAIKNSTYEMSDDNNEYNSGLVDLGQSKSGQSSYRKIGYQERKNILSENALQAIPLKEAYHE